MKRIKYIWIGILFTVFHPHLLADQKMENITMKTAVIFNTLCSKCHEGECSGRLSFDTGSQAASSHIKRYTADVNLSKSEIESFFSLLNYMKTECALWMPNSEKYNTGDLSRFVLPSFKGYFIPLGVLRQGEYHIDMKMKEDIHFKIEIISDHFDHLLNISVCPDRKKDILKFTTDNDVNLFLRIKSRQPLHIIDLELKKDN